MGVRLEEWGQPWGVETCTPAEFTRGQGDPQSHVLFLRGLGHIPWCSGVPRVTQGDTLALKQLRGEGSWRSPGVI